MWKWHCPAAPLLIWESHDQQNALELIANHVGGYPNFRKEGYKEAPCELIHELVDDGVPCNTPNCKIPYVRDTSSERR